MTSSPSDNWYRTNRKFNRQYYCRVYDSVAVSKADPSIRRRRARRGGAHFDIESVPRPHLCGDIGHTTLATQLITTSMHPFRSAFRVAERCANVQTPAYVCRTCRSRLAETQQRHLHNVKPHSQSNTTFRTFTTTSRPQAEQDNDFDQYPDPKKDPNYVEALTSEGLEWVGSDKWVESNQDVGDNFQG